MAFALHQLLQIHLALVYGLKSTRCAFQRQDYPGEAYCAHDERVYLIEDTENKKPNHESICVSHGLLDTNDASMNLAQQDIPYISGGR